MSHGLLVDHFPGDYFFDVLQLPVSEGCRTGECHCFEHRNFQRWPGDRKCLAEQTARMSTLGAAMDWMKRMLAAWSKYSFLLIIYSLYYYLSPNYTSLSIVMKKEHLFQSDSTNTFPFILLDFVRHLIFLLPKQNFSRWNSHLNFR